MSKDCKQARNVVFGLWILLLLGILLLSSCGNTKQLHEKKLKKCCEKTVEAVYEYEGLIVE